MNTILKFISENLHKVRKPARYIGGEYNSYIKDKKEKLRFALVFPDVYEIGMSHYGLEILYHILNSFNFVYAERAFLPWVDMIDLMIKNNVPLYTLETKTPLKQMDAIGISVEYELSYTNIFKVLELSELPLKAEERNDKDPIVIAGGPCVFNPEPISRAFDIIYIGDAEENIGELARVLYETRGENRFKRLELAAKIKGVYVPIFYEQKGKKIVPLTSVPKKIRRNVIDDLDNGSVPVKKTLPNVESVHDRAVVEISRGCTRGCRFCQAGYIYRPVRERSAENIVSYAQNMLKVTGYEELSFLSLSTMDHSQIVQVIEAILPYAEENRISVSIPSTRADAFSVRIMSKIASIRKTGITLAPEAGSQLMRNRINKNISLEDIFKSVEGAKEAGWSRIKLYFMVGFPDETDEDIKEIGNILREVKKVGFKNVVASVNLLVPKPHTPLQFAKVKKPDYMRYVFEILKPYRKFAKIDINNGKKSYIEALLSRGDRKLFDVIMVKYKKAFFDEWSEFFNFDDWLNAFHIAKVNYEDYEGPFNFKEDLPWDHIDSGVNKAFLWKEYENYNRGTLTHDCRWDVCTFCGVCQIYKVRNTLKKNKKTQ
ncbi:TIGR03960 family B12-binding radical SAM protein [Thermosipho ferrireducens]|uniref:TIGR03960 family B12-binding radical SAM protein n=1 Tax=Thermosipho ferrireducens TaxID=2571116 RepID=A0ABX7S630_9BACT|nr:TIGR03960 family B12-binding radical SAM protein [Thermosipho ferrireducens]QTA37313.1 TIGR03960 family B12-binding radical SAM protein [Thermosipho ferrireducens]